MDELQNRIAVVLVRARNPLNIGAAARAMSNFGFTDLRIVNDYEVPFHEARSAIDAAPVLSAAKQFDTVAEAVADCSLVFGTTALGERRLLHPVDLLRDTAPRAHAVTDAGNKVAILFGSEKTGLSAEEMSYCHRLLTVPMHRGGVSMNLGQAVAVCLYEFFRDAASPRTLPVATEAASSAEIARVEGLLREVLVSSEYDRRFPGNMGEDSLRRLVRRLAMPGEDVEIWLGMLRQMLWKLRKAGSTR
jgi:tRNA/rRNA methyltransferase